MRLTLTRPNSVEYERVRWLIAMWGKPGAAAVLGGGGAITPVTDCNLLFLNGNTAQFLDGDDWRLLGCDGAPCNLLFLSGDDFGLLNGESLALLGCADTACDLLQLNGATFGFLDGQNWALLGCGGGTADVVTEDGFGIITEDGDQVVTEG